jgi:hypothetical protein
MRESSYEVVLKVKYSTEHRKLEPRALQRSSMQIQEDVLQMLELVELFKKKCVELAIWLIQRAILVCCDVMW